MGRADIDIRQPVLTGEVIESDEDYLKVIYADMGIEEALAAYLDRSSDTGPGRRLTVGRIFSDNS